MWVIDSLPAPNRGNNQETREDILVLRLGGEPPPDQEAGVDYHIVRRDETLQDIATYYFGSEVSPAALALHNGMGTTEVVPGQVIYLP